MTVGLPGVGKTTRARELEGELDAVRLTTDEWLLPLFGRTDSMRGRDELEGLMVNTARRLLDLGQNVIIDFGVWSRDERRALHDVAIAAGADYRIEYLPADREEQLRRVTERAAHDPHAYVITAADLAGYETMFTAPDADELGATDPGPAPPEAGTWRNWRAERWPTCEV